MSGKRPNEHLTFRKKYTKEKDDVAVEGFHSFWNFYLHLPLYGILVMILFVLFFRFSYLLLDMLKVFTLNISSSFQGNVRLVCIWFFIAGSVLLIRGVYNLLNNILE